jgi:hypothetical protein
MLDVDEEVHTNEQQKIIKTKQNVALGSRKSATQQQTTTNLKWRNWRSVLWRGGRTRGKRIEGSATKTALKK